jgi:hypothetical protein
MYVYVYFEFLFMVHVVAVVIGTSAFGLSSCLRCLFFVHSFDSITVYCNSPEDGPEGPKHVVK